MRAGRALALLAVVAVVAAAAGCDSGEPPPADRFRVALLTPGSIRDGGWNQSAYEGLQRIAAELDAEVGHQETATPQEWEEGFRDFAQRGFDVIFGHGFEFQDPAAKVAAEFPDVVFITTSGSTIRSNVAPVVFELEQATYVLGFVAGKLSRDARVGMLGGKKIPSVASTFSAFAAGAREATPGVDVRESYIGSWTDVAAAREATLALVGQGVDVLIHNANESARGFFQAVAESPDVYAFGTNRNQNDRAPSSVLASATIDIPLALLMVAREVSVGRFTARSVRFGLAEDVVRIEWNDALAARTERLRPAVDRLVEDIKSGRKIVPRGNF